MSAIVLPQDDYFHHPDNNLLWNESAWFHISVPERRIGGFIHISHRPNMNTSLTGVCLYDPSGCDTYDCLYYDYAQFDPLGPSTNTEMFDFRLPNGLSVSSVKPLHSYNITYERNEVKLDLQWNAFMDVHSLDFAEGSEGWGPRHYEQAGVMTGIMTINGEEIPVHCGSNRDHSWGARDYQSRSWRDFPRQDYPWFNDAKGHALNMYTVPTDPPESDPVVGVTDTLLFGWLFRDCKVAPVATATRKAVERRPDGVPLVTVVSGRDELGREFAAEGRMRSVVKWTGLPGLTTFWALTEWTLESGDKIYGETGEVFPSAFLRRFLRSGRI
jgi:hypothetical protein